ANQPDRLREKVEMVRKSTERISRIVNGLRKFSRSADKTELQLHSLCRIAQEAVQMTAGKSRRHSTPVSVQCQSDGAIYCNEIEIEQVLVNLINNGIDAVKKQQERWVRLDIFERESYLVVQVRDSGRGLSPDVQKKLF